MLKTPPFPTQDLCLARWTSGMNRSVLRQMLAVVARPGILSFAGGLPAPEMFPAADYGCALNQVLTADSGALQYGPPFAPLKRHIVDLMTRRGVTCSEEQVFITTGAQQGLAVLTRLLLDPGGEAILEEIVYTGVQQAVSPYQPRILPIDTNLYTGLNVDAVANYLGQGHRPAFLYAIPEAHNPLGVSMSLAKRQQLVELAARYGLPLIEDDPYGFLRYEGKLLPPLRALNADWVFYLGSFSKILAPALRLGWLVAPADLVPKLTVIKEMEDLESSQLTQRAVAAYLDTGHLPGHIERLCAEYGRRRDAMLSALERYFPVEACWTHPSNGMFIWVELPPHINTADLLETAVTQEQVAFIPGHAFALPGHARHNCLRLNFSNCTPDRIEDGIRRLSNVIQLTIDNC
jgi:2-aminoadipate transaminase